MAISPPEPEPAGETKIPAIVRRAMASEVAITHEGEPVTPLTTSLTVIAADYYVYEVSPGDVITSDDYFVTYVRNDGTTDDTYVGNPYTVTEDDVVVFVNAQ